MKYYNSTRYRVSKEIVPEGVRPGSISWLVEGLSPKEKVIIILYCIGGMSYGEIRDGLKQLTGTSKTTLRRIVRDGCNKSHTSHLDELRELNHSQ